MVTMAPAVPVQIGCTLETTPLGWSKGLLEPLTAGHCGVNHLNQLVEGSHDEESRRRMCPSGFDFHGLACLRPET
jgi:hypothetical protein